MQLELTRIKQGLAPVDDDSIEYIKKLSIGDVIIVEWKPKRNIGHHRKLFAMLRAVLPNQSHYKNEKNLLEAIKFRAGYYKTIIPHKGEPFLVAESIAFHAMDEEEFTRFYNEANRVCCELVGDEALEEILRFI